MAKSSRDPGTLSRRDELLACAAELIQTSGYHGFSFQHLADMVGIRKASIHHHFASKEELGIAFCDSKLAELQDFAASIATLSASNKLRRYLNKPKQRLENRRMCGINAMQSDCALMSTPLLEAVRRITRYDTELVAGILQEGLDSGEFVLSSTAHEQAELMVSALKGALQRSLLYHDSSYERVCKALLKQILT